MLTIPSCGSFINVFVVSFIINNLPFSINRKQTKLLYDKHFIGINLLGPYSLIPRYGKNHEALNGNSHQKSYPDSASLQAVIVLTVIELNGPLVTTGERITAA